MARRDFKDSSGPDDKTPESEVEPSEEEIEQWAKRERKRREAWAAGPSDEEKAAWAHRERRRRLIRSSADPEDMEIERLSRHLRREENLAMTGAIALLRDWPFRLLARLVRAGRSWEDEYLEGPGRRNILHDDDDF
jgi:hypothetical protein